MSMKPASSIDPKEVAYYHALAKTWWQIDGPFWPLHVLNSVRMEYLKHQLGDAARQLPFEGVRVLDVGCGGGLLSEAMTKLGAEVTGIDVVARNIEIARCHAKQNDLAINYRLISVEELCLEQPNHFDLLLNMEVVEHVADLEGFMKACCELVRPAGAQVVATINRNPWSWFAAVFVAERVLKILPVGTHHWRKLRRPKEITACLEKYAFSVVASSGVSLNPMTRRMNLSSSLAINYMLVSIKN